MARVLGILLLIAGAVVMIFGVVEIVSYAKGESPDIAPIAIKMGTGIFLLIGGVFTTAFAFHSQITRGVSTVFKRLRGTRIDEEISRLAKLRADGYITGEEYDAAKKKLLGDI